MPGDAEREGDDGYAGDGLAKRERRERKRRGRMAVHGRSLEAIMNAIRKRARRAGAKDETTDGGDARKRGR